MIEPVEQRAARIAGFLYVLTNATAILAFSIRGRLLVRGDAAQTAKKILASTNLFRLGVVFELITIGAVIALVGALYVALRRVSPGLAFTAVLWRVAENVILAYVVMNELAALRLATTTPALAQTFLGLYGDGFRIGFFFLGLGSALFAYLFFKSRYIPRTLAVIGIVGSLLMAIAELSIMACPDLSRVIGMSYMAPIGIFEIVGGFWLLFMGIRVKEQ